MTIPKPCPLCHSAQVQLCADFNNPDKDYCRCRECKTTGPLVLWNGQRPYEHAASILGYELRGVLIDSALSGFDPICRSTVSRVRTELSKLAASTFVLRETL
jgi:hypothetical protein